MHRPTARIARDLRGGSNHRDDTSPDGNNGTRVTTEQQLLQVSSGAHDVTGAMLLAMESLYPACTLGLKWNVEADKFIWDVSTKFQHLVETKPVIRRGILSIVSSFFDPLGFIAPYIIKAKLLLQDLCRKKLGWDTPITEQDRIQWFRWLEDLPKLANLQVDRCFKPKNLAKIKNAQLHIF